MNDAPKPGPPPRPRQLPEWVHRLRISGGPDVDDLTVELDGVEILPSRIELVMTGRNLATAVITLPDVAVTVDAGTSLRLPRRDDEWWKRLARECAMNELRTDHWQVIATHIPTGLTSIPCHADERYRAEQLAIRDLGAKIHPTYEPTGKVSREAYDQAAQGRE